jgi:uncharacterized membrane protein
MFTLHNIIVFITIIFSGLVAGLLYGYSCSVNPGLKNLPDREYIHAMQSINTAIQNFVFFICFIGLLVLLPMSCWFTYKYDMGISFWFVLIATVIYFVGVFVVTGARNVPLNELLEHFDVGKATDKEVSAIREKFESSWVTWHTVRTIASIVSFGVLVAGFFKKFVS